jgi:hypothetical protein
MAVYVRKDLLVGPSTPEEAWGPSSTPQGLMLVEKYRRTNGVQLSVWGAYDPARSCFYCGQPLSGEAVLEWQGSAPDHPSAAQSLWLHPGCFLDLSLRLSRDLHTVQCVMDYRTRKNASPRPAYPPRARPASAVDAWHQERAAGRDDTLVEQ